MQIKCLPQHPLLLSHTVCVCPSMCFYINLVASHIQFPLSLFFSCTLSPCNVLWFISLSRFLFLRSLFSPVYLSVCHTICPSVCLSVRLSIHLFVFLSVAFFGYIFVILFLSVCLYVYSFGCLSTSVCLNIAIHACLILPACLCPSACPSFHPSTYLPSLFCQSVSIRPSIHPHASLFHSVLPPVYPCVIA